MVQKDASTSTKLSLCMITRNEAMLLKKCLDSTANLVDEIIVVDTGSNDGTKRIAAEAGAKVFHYQWDDDFSGARNHSIKQASGDWILILDADETIAKSDHKKIRSAIKDNQVDGYRLVQRTYGNDLRHADYIARRNDSYRESRDYAGWIPSNLVRLFRNKAGFHYSYRIHEVVEPSIEKLGGIIKDSAIPIHHFTYKKDAAFIEKKIDRYVQMGLKQIKETPEDPKPYREIALVYLEANKFSEAEEILLKAEKFAPADPSIQDCLGTLYLSTQRPALAEQALRKGLLINPKETMMLNKLASARMALGDMEEAQSILQSASTISPNNPRTNNNLGLLYAVTNRPSEAANAFKKTLSMEPKNLYALIHLGMIYVSMNRYPEAHPPLQHAYKIAPNDARVLYHLALTSAALGNLKKAEKFIRAAHKILPEDPAIKKKLNELSRTPS